MWHHQPDKRKKYTASDHSALDFHAETSTRCSLADCDNSGDEDMDMEDAEDEEVDTQVLFDQLQERVQASLAGCWSEELRAGVKQVLRWCLHLEDCSVCPSIPAALRSGGLTALERGPRLPDWLNQDFMGSKCFNRSSESCMDVPCECFPPVSS